MHQSGLRRGIVQAWGTRQAPASWPKEQYCRRSDCAPSPRRLLWPAAPGRCSWPRAKSTVDRDRGRRKRPRREIHTEGAEQPVRGSARETAGRFGRRKLHFLRAAASQRSPSTRVKCRPNSFSMAVRRPPARTRFSRYPTTRFAPSRASRGPRSPRRGRPCRRLRRLFFPPASAPETRSGTGGRPPSASHPNAANSCSLVWTWDFGTSIDTRAFQH